MQILCTKYRFDESIEIQELNFYTQPSNYSFVEQVDLTTVLLQNTLSPIEISVETIDQDKKLFFETSNVSLKCFNQELYNGLKLSDFFQIYEQYSYFKYLVNISNEGSIVFTGMIYPENVKMMDRDSEVIDITIVGLEKEFKEYYSNKFIPNVNEAPLPLGEVYWNFNTSNFQNALTNKYFTSPFITGINLVGLSEYYIAENAYLYKPASKFVNDTIFCKTGWKSYQRQNFNLFDFFKSICLSMGWIWYFENKQMILRNRYDITNFPVLEIDYNEKFIKHDVLNNYSEIGGDNIMIDDGEFWSDGNLLSPYGTNIGEVYLGGDRKIVISEKNNSITTTDAFNALKFISTSYEINYSNFKTYTFTEENISNNNFSEFYTYPSHASTTIEKNAKGYNSGMTLKVNPIVNSRDNAAMLDITLARTRPSGENYGNGNFYTTNNQPTGNSFGYRGNPGNCLLRYDYATDRVENYQYYVTTDTFKNNFKPLLRSRLQLQLEIEYDGLITSPSYLVKIKNYPYSNLVTNDTVFSVQKVKFDLIENKSYLTVVKIN